MSEEPLEQKKERAIKILTSLEETYPDARISLNYKAPFQLLVSTILAAQCTDEKVNQVTPGLFEKYPTPEALASADETELQTIIHPLGFYKNKSKSIIEAFRDIVTKYDSELPDTIEELTSFHGVGRKTANVILGEIYKKPSIVVDTHVKRLSGRLGLTDQTDPTKIEFDLMKVVPEDWWIKLNHLFIFHGRAICKAPTPLCERCGILDLCPFGRERMGKEPLY